MVLTSEERQILNGKRGRTLQKVMQSLVRYAEALGANQFADIEGQGHFAIPDSTPGLGPPIEMLDDLVEARLKTKYPFTLDPRSPQKSEDLYLTPEQEKRFREISKNQPRYDLRMHQLGLLNEKAYTCTPYLAEVGNTPKRGAVLAWSESSCVVYANSVLAARTNRNAAIMDLLSNIAGKTPLTGLLTDEGRRAHWLVNIETSTLPDPQLLGAAVGMTVQEDVPYITGLDRFLGKQLTAENRDYLKEMGAASAAIGAVGLFHVESLTPEAVAHKRDLLRKDHRVYNVNDSAINKLLSSIPVKWEDTLKTPRKCLIGCPHLSLRELNCWSERILLTLQKRKRSKLAVKTILCAAPQIVEIFKKDVETHARLRAAGVRVSAICPEAYMENELCAAEAVITNSAKLQTFTPARLFLDDFLLDVMISGNPHGKPCQ